MNTVRHWSTAAQHRGVQVLLAAMLGTALLFILAATMAENAKANASFWHIETVDGLSNSGWCASLALDSAGQPHIITCPYPDHVVRYTYHNATGWHSETVDGFDGGGASLVLDALDRPRLVYRFNGLRYAFKDESGWHIETVDSAPGAGNTASLVLDDAGYPHIAYTDDARLAYATLDSAGWHVETIDALGGLSVSVQLDTAGNPHVGYQRDGMRYASWGPNGWELSLVEAGSSVTGGDASLVLDSEDVPHVSYDYWVNIVPGSCGSLNSASWDGASWVIRNIDSCGGGGSLARGIDDQLQVSYHYLILMPSPPRLCAETGQGPCAPADIPAETGLRHAVEGAGTWSYETIEGTEGSSCIGLSSSLALDSRGTPRIAYSGVNCELKFAYRESATPVELTALSTTASPVSKSPGSWLSGIAAGTLATAAILAWHRRRVKRLIRG